MSNYKRPGPAVDVSIEEIGEGNFRVRLVGTIVAVTPGSILLNDGTGQISIQTTGFESNDFHVQKLARCVVDATNSSGNITGRLLAFNSLSKDQLETYQKIVTLERRINRK